MRTELLAALALAGACGALERPGADALVPAAAPPSIQDACELTAHRCSACHTLDRVVAARVGVEPGWQPYVRRMRLMSGSGILADEEPLIVRCLDYHSFGGEP